MRKPQNGMNAGINKRFTAPSRPHSTPTLRPEPPSSSPCRYDDLCNTFHTNRNTSVTNGDTGVMPAHMYARTRISYRPRRRQHIQSASTRPTRPMAQMPAAGRQPKPFWPSDPDRRHGQRAARTLLNSHAHTAELPARRARRVAACCSDVCCSAAGVHKDSQEPGCKAQSAPPLSNCCSAANQPSPCCGARARCAQLTVCTKWTCKALCGRDGWSTCT